VVVQLIGSTTTDTGLKVDCAIDGNLYPKDIQLSDKGMAELHIKSAKFHPEWNYTISPEQRPP
jgi:hypothetical protein